MGYSTLKAALDAVVKTNGRQQITGSNLNGVMTQILQGVDILDRANPADTSGMNHVVLKSNRTFAEQVTGTNTIFEIRDNFNLGGASVTIPSDSILFFNGGKVSNGTLTGNKTAIVAAPVKIFDGITMTGTFTNASAQLNWWCVPSVGVTDVDVTADLQLAFDSPMREFVLNGVYSISSPVLLPSHSVIKGHGAETFKKYGFKALSGFTTKTINDPRVAGRTWVVSGMFYHYYDYKPYLREMFIDAQKNAKFCIEHVVGYSWSNVDHVWLGNARFACMVQYACEQPIYNHMTCVNSHIGFLSSMKKLVDGDIISPSGTNIGSNNIIQCSHCIIQGCNYGMVVNGGTNLSLHSCKFGYNSIAAMVLVGTRAYVSDVYSEGDGICNFWINPDTGEKTTAASGQSLAYLSEASHVIGGVTTEGRLDGFTPAFDFKFTASATGVKTSYRSPFFIKETTLNVESAFVSFINRGRGVSPMPPTPEETTHDGVDSIFLTEVSTLNLVNVNQYNHDNPGKNSMYAYVIDFVPSNTAQTLSMITSDATRRIAADNNTKIITTAPCNSAAADFVRIPGIGFKWGYKVNNYPTGGLNQDIESRLRGAGYDVNHYKYNYKQNVFAGLIKNVPLYRKTMTAGGLDGLYFRKEDLTSIFGDREQVKVVFYAKLLNDVASGTISFSIQYSSTYYTHLVTKNVVCSITNGKAGDMYRIQQIVFMNPPRDANIDSTWNYLYLRNYSSIADTDIALTDLLLYDVEDGDELAPVYQSFYMTSGTTAKRPAVTDVPVGFTYFDTDLGKTIVSNGTAWVNMDGTPLA